TRTFSLTIEGVPRPNLQITTSTLPSATVSQAYSTSLAAIGGAQPYTWAVAGLPSDAGLTLNPVTGMISGVPRKPGTYDLAVKVADQAGTPPATRTFTLSVGNAPGANLLPYIIE